MDISNVSQTLRLREYYYMAARHKIWFFCTVGIFLIISIFIAFSLPKAYQAQTVLMSEEGEILNPLISGLAIFPRMSERMRTLREELLSWQRLTLLVEKLQLDKNIKGPLEYERLIKGLRNNIAIRMRENNEGGTKR